MGSAGTAANASTSPSLVGSEGVDRQTAAQPTGAILPLYQTEREAIVAGWLDMANKGECGMLLLGMGETYLITMLVLVAAFPCPLRKSASRLVGAFR